jgi:hypothetical protein
MRARKYPVMIETNGGKIAAGMSASSSSTPVEVSLALKEKGWTAYRVQFDLADSVWVARVIDWGLSA